MEQVKSIRPQAEVRYKEELDALAAADGDNRKPLGWKLSPRAVRDFILGRPTPLEYQGKEVHITKKYLGNDALVERCIITLTGSRGRTVAVSASSLGGGRIRVKSIDGLEAAFSGDLPTLVIRGKDEPGVVSEVSACLARRDANIATMQLYRDRRGGLSVTVIECDQPVSEEILEDIDLLGGVVRCIYLNLEEG